MSDPAGLSPARVFLALWPETPVRQRMAEAGRRLHLSLGGRLTRPETIHLTLVFIGNLARDRLADLSARLAEIESPGFEVVFDLTDCWRHNRVAFLAPSVPPDALTGLVAKLEAALTELAIRFDRRPYKAHVTLLRKADCGRPPPARGTPADRRANETLAPIRWSARQFVLVESVPTPDGVRYDLLGSYALSLPPR